MLNSWKVFFWMHKQEEFGYFWEAFYYFKHNNWGINMSGRNDSNTKWINENKMEKRSPGGKITFYWLTINIVSLPLLNFCLYRST